MTETIQVTVKLFAAYQEAYGLPELNLSLPAGTTVEQICDRIYCDHPQLAALRPVTRFGINLQFVTADTCLQTGDEVVLIPPVSGG
jgi:sulfur-carrier protein